MDSRPCVRWPFTTERRTRADGPEPVVAILPAPMSWLSWLLIVLRAGLRTRRNLVLENLALRQQLNVARRSVKRPRLTDADRVFWIGLVRVFPGWRECLCLVKPETVLGWHRKGWRAYWRWKSKARKAGRPPIGWRLVRLIHRLSRENPTWGAPRIRSELLLLGHDVGESTVARYMARNRHRGRGQSWMTFLRNHLKVTAACDFFTVPTITFRNLYVLVVLSHDRRLIRHVAVTAHPTAEWTARQILEAFPGGEEPKFLLRDNDAIYGDDFTRLVKAAAIREITTGYRSPWQNPYAERVIGTLRRECTDHLLVLGERHLERALREYVGTFYNLARPHLSLDGNSPLPRTREATPAEVVIATPVLGGLHHTYRRAA